jgi:ribosomal protein S18 acetylase RimI-like enzyme
MAVTTWTLALDDPGAVRPTARPAPAGFAVEARRDPALNAEMYRRVGADHAWTDRLSWPPERWEAWAERVETWVAVEGGAVAGYVELDPGPDEVEIAIFGLLPEATGRGLGGHLLTAALHRCFVLAPRAWVHTCSLDGPHALANYRARGLRVVREDVAP